MNPTAAHVVPFGAWLFLMWFLDTPALAPAWAYTFRTAATVIALLVCRPWRWYESPRARDLPTALGIGVGVFAVWVFFESPWCPGFLRNFYSVWLVRPWGEPRLMPTAHPYDPALIGWGLAGVRLAGSALVIAVAEEFFWRGFAYRWLFGGDFLAVSPGRMDPIRFAGLALVFGLEHQEWFAGLVAGLAYGWIFWRTRNIWAACAAHIVTNFALGLYVLAAGAWQFW